MRNLHLILLQEDGVEVQCLFRLWEKLQLRTSEYKNHRIFTLRCLHNELIPTSIKLKLTLKSTRANKILRKAEKELLQTRVKSINYILDNISQQLEECRSQLAAIISAQRLRECQDFVDKVGEIRFNKVKQRQLNKFNLLINRKEGNITRSNNTNSNTNNLTIQSGSHINQNNQINQTTSQVNPPTGEGSIPSQAGNSVNSQAPAPRNPTLAIALLPPGEGSSSPLATGHLPLEGTGLPQANSQVIGSHPTPAIAHLPPREGSNSPLVTVHPSLEGNQASGSLPSQAIALLPPEEGSNFLPGAVHLPSKDDSYSQAIVLLPSGEENSSFQATSLLPHRERNSSSQSSRSTWAGQGHNPPGQAGKVIGTPQAQAYTAFPGGQCNLPGKATTPPHPLVGPTKVLQRKNQTLSGSLTFPTNP